MSLNSNNVTFTHFDTTSYSTDAGGNYLSGKSKVAFYAAVPTNENVYRMRIEFPNTTSYETGHSRNLLSFTGNTKAVGNGMYEWQKAGKGSISTTTDNPSGNSETAGTKTLFTFGALPSNGDDFCTFWTGIRQYIKARHTDFRFTAWVKGDSGKTFNIQIMAFGSAIDEVLSISTTGSWQYINMSLSGRNTEYMDFGIYVFYTGTSGTGTLQMIEPMLAVDNAFSNTYTWCPNAMDNYRNWPSDADVWTKNAYNTETRTAYLDGIDNTFVPIIANTSASGLYDITVHIDYFGSNDGKYDDTFDIVPKINVSAYDIPRITSGTSHAYRSDSNGTKNESGNYFSYEANILAFPINISNPKTTTFRMRYKPHGTNDELIEAGTATIASTSAQTIKITSSATIEDDTAYDVIFEYKDYYMSEYSNRLTFVIPTSFVLIDYHYSGKGISFGRIATNEIVTRQGMDINMPMYLTTEAAKGTINFTTGDNISADQWANVNKLESTDTIGTVLNKISTTMANVRYLYSRTGGFTSYYKADDTFDPVGVICAGLLTGSGKSIYFYIPLPKPIWLDNVSSITIPTSYSNMIIRHSDGGYVMTSGTTIASMGTLTAKPRYGGIQCTLTLSTAVSFTNNAPVTVMFNGSTTITFNE